MYAVGNINYNGGQTVNSGTLPGVTAPIASFSVGDGQDGVPVNGATSLQVVTLCNQNIVDKQLLVCREGILLLYASAPGFPNQISRYNHGGLGGWTFTVAAGLSFVQGERYDVYIIGNNYNDQT